MFKNAKKKLNTQQVNFKSRVYFSFHEAVYISLLMKRQLWDQLYE